MRLKEDKKSPPPDAARHAFFEFLSHTSYLIPHTSYLIPHTSYLPSHTSHLSLKPHFHFFRLLLVYLWQNDTQHAVFERSGRMIGVDLLRKND